MSRVERLTPTAALIASKYIIAGGTYIVKTADSVQRVRAIKSFEIENRFYCDCFFIDIGKFEAISHDKLCTIVGEYRNIAPQAICFKLFGFDELFHCPYIEQCFGALLTNKQFVACLMMAESQYQVQLDHGIKIPKVSITPFIFYPKFTLLKPILLKQIGDALPKPAFTHANVIAKVSYVSPMGLVYFQLDERSIIYIDTLIQQFVNENQQQLTRRFRHSEMANCVVLIYDIEQNMYHRAKIMGVEAGSSTKYKCYCMDKGFNRSNVDASNIFVLHENSILSYYPSQAVGAKLHLLPTFEDIAFNRLNDILANNVKVLVKVVDQKRTHPLVTVFKHSMNINEFIRMEVELHK